MRPIWRRELEAEAEADVAAGIPFHWISSALFSEWVVVVEEEEEEVLDTLSHWTLDARFLE